MGLVRENGMEKRQTYTVDQAGEILGIGRNAAYEGVRSGQIPAIRIGRRIVVPKVALDRMLAGDAVQLTPPELGSAGSRGAGARVGEAKPAAHVPARTKAHARGCEAVGGTGRN
jgi:excisionase family DNA binding protein